MKPAHLAVAATLALTAVSSKADAKGAMFQSGPTIAYVADLNDTKPQGERSLGWLYNHVVVFWMPFWASEGQWVLYTRTDSSSLRYRSISEEEAMAYAVAADVEAAQPSFMSLWWGWFVVTAAFAPFH